MHGVSMFITRSVMDMWIGMQWLWQDVHVCVHAGVNEWSCTRMGVRTSMQLWTVFGGDGCGDDDDCMYTCVYGMAAIPLDHVTLSAAWSRKFWGEEKGGASIKTLPGVFIIACHFSVWWISRCGIVVSSYWDSDLINTVNFHQNQRHGEITMNFNSLFRVRRSMCMSKSKIINFSLIFFMLEKDTGSTHENFIFKWNLCSHDHWC